MPWKMVFFLIILAVVVFFAGFNITNVSDISFGVYTVSDVPIFISLFVAFVAGTLVMIPFVAKKKLPKKKVEKEKKIKKKSKTVVIPDDALPDLPALDESDSPRFEKE